MRVVVVEVGDEVIECVGATSYCSAHAVERYVPMDGDHKGKCTSIASDRDAGTRPATEENEAE